MKPSTVWRIAALVVILLAAAGGVIWLRGKGGDRSVASALSFETVERRSLTVTIEATGTVEPVNLVEVKSKASGQIIRMPVDVGSHVRAGDLLVQIDTVDVQNSYRQAKAALEAALVQAEVAAAQKKRAEELFASEILTAPEHESALLTDANAQSSLVRARTELENARLRLLDATVRAPTEGTILGKPVSVGQVISSATSSVSGGTTLLTMADLRRIRVRALVPESDIGGVHEGMPAMITVDAYPNQPFEGRVEKVEPQAVVQQSVTMFPVLLAIENEAGLLLPGMNGEVVVTTARLEDALAVPVDAVRSMREISTVALALGVTTDSLRAGLRAGRNGNGDRSGVPGASAAASSGSSDRAARGDSSRARGSRRRANGVGGRVDSLSRAVPAGVSGGSNGRNSLFAIVKSGAGYRAKYVRLGVSNFDYAQVLGGLQEGDSVAILGAAEMQAERNQSISRIRERVGTGLPGSTGGGGGTRTGGGGGSAGRGPGG